jgi:hypothetical protein
MDDRDHAGFQMEHVVERAANAETVRRFPCLLAADRRSTPLNACGTSVCSFADQAMRPTDRRRQLYRPYSRPTLRLRVIAKFLSILRAEVHNQCLQTIQSL